MRNIITLLVVLILVSCGNIEEDIYLDVVFINEVIFDLPEEANESEKEYMSNAAFSQLCFTITYVNFVSDYIRIPLDNIPLNVLQKKIKNTDNKCEVNYYRYDGIKYTTIDNDDFINSVDYQLEYNLNEDTLNVIIILNDMDVDWSKLNKNPM
jgi:hypothetical protein